MKAKLYPQDFTLEHIDDYNYKYFIWSNDDNEICLEPRSSGGFDVALYDHNGILIGGKSFVEPVAGETTTACFLRAVEVANVFYQQITSVSEEKALTVC